MDLPQSYTISKFFTHTEGARQYSNYLIGGCPICHEGNSWGSKRRLYYYLSDDFLYCYNCSRSWNPYWWVKEVTNLSFKEIKLELEDCGESIDYIQEFKRNTEQAWEVPELPGECVNLKSELQTDFYRNNKIVQLALKYCQDRRLFTAINSPKALFVSLRDKYHQNRLIIPTYRGNSIESYTSRRLLDSDHRAKYLLKFNSPKPLFGFDKIDADLPYIFLFEGQIDSMFVRNGVALSGLDLTKEHEEQLQEYPFHQRIWVYDNLDFENDEVKGKAILKLKNNESLFLFKNEFSKFKDLNEFCVEKKQDFVDPALILSNVFMGGKGLINL